MPEQRLLALLLAGLCLAVFSPALLFAAAETPAEPAIEFYRDVFNFDTLHITITSPQHNLDDDVIEAIGGTGPGQIRISSGIMTVENYRLVETGADTGAFTGRLFLADPDDEDFAASYNWDNGPKNGMLRVDHTDNVAVSFEFDGGTITNATDIRVSLGEMRWLEAVYPAGMDVIRTDDPGMDADPETAESIDVEVYSDSDENGITIAVTETGPATGIFEGTVLFVTDGESSGNRLRVSGGDTVTATYEYDKPPATAGPYGLNVAATRTIDTAEPPQYVQPDDDADGDKIPDISDRCIAEPEDYNGYHDYDGCPDTVPDSATGPLVELDREGYSWTDRVYVTIVSQSHNLDGGLAEEIGAGPDAVRISTGAGTLENYTLVETGNNTGIFAGRVALAGFSHDLDTIPYTGDIYGNDVTTVAASGEGPAGGLLPVLHDDHLSVSFLSKGGEAAATAHIGWSVAEVMWLEENYLPGDAGIVRITEPDLNLHPDRPDILYASAWSDSDRDGFGLVMNETGTATGIFEGTVPFATDPDASDDYLHVLPGDVVTVQYKEKTLPPPHDVGDADGMTDTATIELLPPADRAGTGADADGDGISDESDFCLRNPENRNGYQDDDGCPDIIPGSALIEPVIELDRRVYDWVDRARVTITSPSHNFDPGLVDEIGGTTYNPVRVSAGEGSIDNFRLFETGEDTGVFAGEIALTGFAHDVDGDESTGTGGTDTDPRTADTGLGYGHVPARPGDRLAVSFEYSEGLEAGGSAPVRWHYGEIYWDKSPYPVDALATIWITDPDLNLDPDDVDDFYIDAWSDSDPDVLRVWMIEAGKNSGLFKGHLRFTDYDAPDVDLAVSMGDTLTARYQDHTLPAPYGISDHLDVLATVSIGAPQHDPRLATDADSDGISNRLDECPEYPETVNGHDDADGCPDALPDLEVQVPEIVFDQEEYTWTEKIHVSIISPYHNFDPGKADVLGMPGAGTVTASTRDAILEDYRLVEFGWDRGVFTGDITLTGFLHDADGDESTGHGGVDTYPTTYGEGTSDGFLHAYHEDELTVSFEYGDQTVTGTVPVRWNVGQVMWLDAGSPALGAGIVRVIDPDMGLTEDDDSLDVRVWSDTDPDGIVITLDETLEDSGIFDGEVLFDGDGSSSGDALRVSEGDTVTAVYGDHTLPAPYGISEHLDVTAETTVGPLVDPPDMMDAANLRTANEYGSRIDNIITNYELYLVTDLENRLEADQEFVYLVHVRNLDGMTVFLDWVTGSIPAGGSLSPGLPWTPTEVGTYYATALVWDNLNSPRVLALPVTTTFETNDGWLYLE